MRKGTTLCVAAALAVGAAVVGCDRSEENKNVAPSNTRSAANTPDNVARREAQLAAERRNEAKPTPTTSGTAGVQRTAPDAAVVPSYVSPTTRPSGVAQ